MNNERMRERKRLSRDYSGAAIIYMVIYGIIYVYMVYIYGIIYMV